MVQYVKVPKGTVVYQNWWDLRDKKNGTTTKRDVVVKADIRAGQTDWNGVVQPKSCSWGTGSNLKITEADNVIETDAPAPRKAPDESKKKVQLRTRMVKGTKWKLTQDAQVSKCVNVQVPNPWRAGFITERQLAPDFTIPAGTEITVTGKSQTYGPGYVSGIWIPIEYAGKKILIEYKELNKTPEPEQVGEAEIVPMFVIRDKATGHFYCGYEYGYYDYSQRVGSGSAPYVNGSGLTYSEKLTKAKKFKRLADVRVHALIQSGYYDDLPESYGSVPEWMCGRKLFDVPETWEIVKMDKVTKQEVETIELIDTYKRSWKLRELTVKYSSDVRKVYSDLEKKNKVAEWSAIMMFKKKSDDYWYHNELTPAEIADVNALLGRFGGDVKIQKGTSGFAVAIKDAMTATLVRLAYQGDLECAIVDFETMSEVVK